MQKLKLQDTNWVIYQQDRTPAHWQLGEGFHQQYGKLLRGIPQEQIDAFLSENFLEALDGVLDEQDWQADYNGYTGEIEVSSPHGELTEEAVRQMMDTAIDETVLMLLDALNAG